MPRRLSILWLALLIGCGQPRDQAARPAGHGPKSPPAPVKVAPFAMARPDAVLLVTGMTQGRMEICNCFGPMPAGLSRRSGLVLSYRAAFPNTLLVDTGDVLWIRPEDLRNRYMFEAYRVMGYDAVTMGDYEWNAAGLLAERLRDARVPLLATGAAPDAPAPTVPEIIHEFGQAKVALLSWLSPRTTDFMPAAARGQTTDLAAVAKAAARLKAAGCVVILIAHADEFDLTDLKDAKELADIDLILRGHSSQTEDAVQKLGRIPVVKVGGPEFVGAVALKIEGGKLAGLEYRAEVVDTRWPLDRRCMDVYQAFAHEALRQMLDEELKLTLHYVPSATCGRCHPKQYQAWLRDPHSRAYRTLADADMTSEMNCLGCHTSGLGTAGGFRGLEKTPDLAGVNCQDCHRFNLTDGRHGKRGHSTFPAGLGGTQPAGTPGKVECPLFPTEDTCTVCHTPINSPQFEYDKYLPYVCCRWARAGHPPLGRPGGLTKPAGANASGVTLEGTRNVPIP